MSDPDDSDAPPELKVHNLAKKKAPKKAPTHICDICDKGYVNVPAFCKHVFLCADPTNRTCTICGKVLPTLGKRKLHEADSECYRTWHPHVPPPKRPRVRYTKRPGPTVNMEGESPVEIFLRFVKPWLPIWIRETNRRGPILFPEEKMRRHKRRPWHTLSVSEALRWLAVFLQAGLIANRRIGDPWKRSYKYNNRFFVATMSRNRFYQILRASHFVDNDLETRPGGRGCRKTPETFKPSWKIDDVITKVIHTSQALFNPGAMVTVDETMVKFIGASSYIQRMPQKPIKRGFKLWALADAQTGYLLNFAVYMRQEYPAEEEIGANGAVVVAMLRGDNVEDAVNYLLLGLTIYSDNFYTSNKTIEYLDERGTMYCGTIPEARRLPPSIRNPTGRKFKRGDYRFRHSNTGVTLCYWKDRKDVRIAYNLPHIGRKVGCVDRKVSKKSKRRKGKEWKGWFRFTRPECVALYNRYMKGVDLHDQLNASAFRRFRTARWYMALFYQVIGICVVNSFSLYKCFNKEYKGKDKKEKPAFQDKVVDGLVHVANKLEKRIKEHSELKGLDKKHSKPHPSFKALNPQRCCKAETMARRLNTKEFRLHPMLNVHPPVRCVVHAQRTQVTWGCYTCGFAMCRNPCWFRFHYLKKYIYFDKNKPRVYERTKSTL